MFIGAADLNHLAVDVETVAKRLAAGRKKKLDVAASDISNPAGEHSKTTTLSPDRCSSKRLEVDEESALLITPFASVLFSSPSRDISIQSSGNCNCELRSGTPDCNGHAEIFHPKVPATVTVNCALVLLIATDTVRSFFCSFHRHNYLFNFSFPSLFFAPSFLPSILSPLSTS
ncbi:unnamed protein product [Dibothriocephalus latus]|uniref:Uncharacterized protein n=1 Tax=Dibothriocephalus latus TaxID=60516 RepID=A0A3P7M7W2_DIBLA|nr:unnamed protein product [Dibothriocephalus latus]